MFALARMLVLGFIAGALALAALIIVRNPHDRTTRIPDPPALVERVREVARLETLTVSVHKKVSYEPGPPPSESLFGEVVTWAAHTIGPPRGKAIVFADVHLGLDLARIDESTLRVRGETVELVLPPVVSFVEIKPGETEVIRSNLDATEVSRLLDDAKFAIERDVMGDAAMQDRARGSARRALRTFLLGVGFRDVVFIEPAGSMASS